MSEIDYRCGACLEPTAREALFAKRVQYKQMGERGKVIKTRVVYWVCGGCMKKEEDFNLPATPGRVR